MSGEPKMRKVLYQLAIDPSTFEPVTVIKMRDEDGTVIVLLKENFNSLVDGKYTPEQRAKIDQTNALLLAKGHRPLTEEECDWMLVPSSHRTQTEDPAEEELQRLAGFKVEKKITYFADVPHEENS